MTDCITLSPNHKPGCQGLAWLQVTRVMLSVPGGNKAPAACSHKWVTASLSSTQRGLFRAPSPPNPFVRRTRRPAQMAVTCETNRSDNCPPWPGGESTEPGTAQRKAPSLRGAPAGRQGRGGGKEPCPKRKAEVPKRAELIVTATQPASLLSLARESSPAQRSASRYLSQPAPPSAPIAAHPPPLRAPPAPNENRPLHFTSQFVSSPRHIAGGRGNR